MRFYIAWQRNRTMAHIVLVALVTLVSVLEIVGFSTDQGACIRAADLVAVIVIAPLAGLIALCELACALSTGRE